MLLVNAASTGVLTQIAPCFEKGPRRGVTLISVYALAAAGWRGGSVRSRRAEICVSHRHGCGAMRLCHADARARRQLRNRCVILIGLMQGAEADVLAASSPGYLACAPGDLWRILHHRHFRSALGIAGYGRLYDLTSTASRWLSGGMLAAAAALYLAMPPLRPGGLGTIFCPKHPPP